MRVIDRRWWARGDSGESETVEESRDRKPTVVEELEQRLAGAQEQLQAVLLEHRRAAAQDGELARGEHLDTRARQVVARL